MRLLDTEDHYLLILINPSKYGTSTQEDLTRWKVKFTLKAAGVGYGHFPRDIASARLFEVFPQ